MEFLRFGSSIPGSYWGCCAIDVIQNFSVDPDDKASIELVSGDGGDPLSVKGEVAFAGPTYRDIFKTRLRIGTFGTEDMPNHAFFASMTEHQIQSGNGKKWLAILKEHGFEFVRAVDNSVYTGGKVLDEPGEGKRSPKINYIFGLFRNIGEGAIVDPFTPPKAWADLPQVKPEVWVEVAGPIELNLLQQEADLKIWDDLGKPTFHSKKELEKAGVPITLAGKRSRYPQQSESARAHAEKLDANVKDKEEAAPFAMTR